MAKQLAPETTQLSTTDLDTVDDRPRSPFGKVMAFLGKGDGDLARILVLVLIIAVIAAVAPSFLSKASWLALSQAATVTLLLALGQSFVIISGGIDLSVGAVMASSAMIGAYGMREMTTAGMPPETTIATGILITVGVAAVMGLVNGLVITVMNITPFIATLGMLSIATGTMNLISGGVEIVGLPYQLGSIGNGTVLGGWFTIPVITTIVLAIVAGLVLKQTKFGLRTYVVGSNQGAARRAGVRVKVHLIGVYVLSAALAGVAGFLLTARYTSASPLSGQSMELASIAAAVIGGASLVGGRGSIVGTVVGAMIMAVLQIGLILARVQTFWQAIAIGVITILAVFGDQLRTRFSNSR